jgi:hypothetical protein
MALALIDEISANPILDDLLTGFSGCGPHNGNAVIIDHDDSHVGAVRRAGKKYRYVMTASWSVIVIHINRDFRLQIGDGRPTQRITESWFGALQHSQGSHHRIDGGIPEPELKKDRTIRSFS